MAIAFNAATDGGSVTAATSITYSHTTGSSSNRLLITTVLGDHIADLITGVTYGGVAMTLIDKQFSSGTNRWHYQFYQLNPATGPNNVVVSASGTCDFILGGTADYSGVKQSAQPDASTKQISGVNVTTLTTSLTTVADNSWTVLCELGYNANNPPTAGSGLTLRAAGATFGAWGLFDSNAAITPAGSYSMTTNRSSGSLDIAHIAASFQPDTGGAFQSAWAVNSNAMIQSGARTA